MNNNTTKTKQRKPIDKMVIYCIIVAVIVGFLWFAFIQAFRRDKMRFTDYTAIWSNEVMSVTTTGKDMIIYGTMLIDNTPQKVTLKVDTLTYQLIIYDSNIYNEMQANIDDKKYNQDYGKLYLAGFSSSIFSGCMNSVTITIRIDYLAENGAASSRIGEEIKLIKHDVS